MRNLKRALSLALASVMLMGMMVVGSSAASFPDVDDENNVEAIAVLEAVKVMIGNEKGDFEPEKNVTRNEMAVIMAKLILGTYEADSYVGSHPFNDVPDWASRYVAACYNSGIIAGRSATTYDGNATVTAVEAAAMMLRALGYEDLSKGAAQWDQPVAAKANEINLFSGLGGNSQAPMNRDSVAKLALNTLEATMVTTVREGQDITLPDGTTIVGTRRYELRTTNADWKNAISSEGNPGGATYLQLGEQLYKGDLVKDADGQSDDFGRPAVKWEYKGETIVTAAEGADLTYTEAVKGKTIRSDLNKGNFTYNADPSAGEFAYYEDGVASDPTYTIDKNEDDKFGGKGTLTQVYYDIDSKSVTVVVTNSYLAEVSGDYDESDKELDIASVTESDWSDLYASLSTTLSGDDFAGLDAFKDGDKVIVTVASDDETASGQYIASIKLADQITGTVNGYKVDDSVTVDDTKRSYNATYEASTKAGNTFTVGNDYDLWLDDYGNILKIDGVSAEDSEYVFIKETKSASGLSVGGDIIGAAYFTDGTFKSIDITKYDGSNATVGCATDAWCTFTVKDGKYELSPVTMATGSGKNEDNEKATENGKVTINLSGGNATKGTSATIFITRDDDNTVKKYVGIKDVPTITAAATSDTYTYAVANSNGYAKYVFIEVGDGTKTDLSTSSDLIYIVKLGTKKIVDADKNSYWEHDAIVNGEIGKIKSAAVDTFEGTGLFTDVQYDENDFVSSAVLLTADNSGDGETYKDYTVSAAYSNVAVTQNNRTLTIGTDSYYLAEGAKIFRIADDSDRTVKIPSASTFANEFKAGGLSATVYGALKDGEYTELYIDLGQTTPPVTTLPSDTTAADVNSAMNDTPGDYAIDTPDAINGIAVPAGSSLTISGAINADGAITTTGDGAVVLDSTSVGADVDLSGAGDVTLDSVSVAADKTLSVTDAALTGTIELASGATLNVSGTVTAEDLTITAAATAKIVVENGANVDALAGMGLEFFNFDGSRFELTTTFAVEPVEVEAIPAGEYVYNEDADGNGAAGWKRTELYTVPPVFEGEPELSGTTLTLTNGATADTSITVTMPAATGYSSSIAFSSASDKGTDVATVSTSDSGATGTISITPKAVGTGNYIVTVTQTDNSATWTGTITVTVEGRTTVDALTNSMLEAASSNDGLSGITITVDSSAKTVDVAVGTGAPAAGDTITVAVSDSASTTNGCTVAGTITFTYTADLDGNGTEDDPGWKGIGTITVTDEAGTASTVATYNAKQ